MKVLRPLTCLVLLGLVGCADNVRPLTNPIAIDSYCGNGVPRKTALLSILTSIPDMPPRKAVHAPSEMQRVAKTGGGLVAHFDDLNLALAHVAGSVGSKDGYVHIRTVVVSPAAGTIAPRLLEIELQSPQGFIWRAFDAYDLQNVCIVGTRKS